ncbi:MAG: BTAD domain-containing putative transcriptional regulator [Candidatus Dormibacteraceae bacterium]
MAADAAREAVRLEPYRESGHPRSMCVQAGMGDRPEAVRVLGELKRLLDMELGGEPAEATQSLYREIAG